MDNFNGSNLLQPRVLCCSLQLFSAVRVHLPWVWRQSVWGSFPRWRVQWRAYWGCSWRCWSFWSVRDAATQTQRHTHTHIQVIGVRGISQRGPHRWRRVRLRFRGCRVHVAHLHGQTDGVEKDECEHQVLKVGGVDHVPHLVLIGVLGDVAPQRARL